MSIVRYSFRAFIALLLSGLPACNWLTEEPKSQRAIFGSGEWFYKECHQLDSVQINFEAGVVQEVKDSILLALSQEERVLNYFEPFCKIVDSSSFQLVVSIDNEVDSSGFFTEKNKIRFVVKHLEDIKTLSFREDFRKEMHQFFLKSRYANFLLNGYNKSNFSELQKRHSFTLKLPDGFEIVRQKKDFIWARTNESNINAHILVYRKPYLSEEQFELPELVQLRDSILQQHMFYKKYDSTCYAQTEFYFSLEMSEGRLPKSYSKRISGCWTVNKDAKRGFAMAGPFLAFGVVGESQPENFYYIEGFFSAPNEDKLPFIRTLEAILRTFELNSYE